MDKTFIKETTRRRHARFETRHSTHPSHSPSSPYIHPSDMDGPKRHAPQTSHYFADSLLLPAEDRHYVSDSLNKLLRSRPSVRRRWLRRVRSARASMIKHGTSQISINKFFTRIQRQDRVTQPRSPTPVSLQETTTADSITAPPLPQQTQERIPGRPPDTTIFIRPVHRTNTTQQRMTEFPRPTSRPASATHYYTRKTFARLKTGQC
jgi:hypothetical protein